MREKLIVGVKTEFATNSNIYICNIKMGDRSHSVDPDKKLLLSRTYY